MRILLINPPSLPEEIVGKKSSCINLINIMPSLGLTYLAAVSEQKNHTVKIVDCSLGLGYDDVVQEAVKFMPEIIGITATTPVFQNAVRVATLLRKKFPQAKFVCGGSHVSASPADAIKEDLFDFVVLGEGEETLIELISFLERKTSLSLEDIRGVSFKRDGRLIVTSARSRIVDLDSIPLPARHLWPPLSEFPYTPASYKKFPVAVVITSRGCPSSCTFCDRSVFGEKFRKRSVSNVMAEVEELIRKYGVREIRFFDDTFTLDPKHVEGICKAMKKLRPRIPWTCLTRVTSVNPDMLKMMLESGCWQVLFGLESGDDGILQHLGKGNTVKQNKEAVFWAKKAGLSVRADFVVGSPWETKESLQRTLEFAKALPLDFAHFNKFVPYPGTAIYKNLIATGYKIRFDINNGSYMSNHSDFIYIPKALSPIKFRNFLDMAQKEFYLRPGYILRRLLSLRSLPEFIGQVRGFFSILNL